MFDLSDFLKDILSSLIGPPGSGRDDEQSRRRQWTGIILLAIVMESLLLWIHMNSMAGKFRYEGREAFVPRRPLLMHVIGIVPSRISYHDRAFGNKGLPALVNKLVHNIPAFR